MSVFRVEKNSNYTIMSNYHLRDQNLSLKAKGLLSYMLSLPEDWDYSLSGLCAICKEQECAIKSTLKELKEHGYVKVEKIRGEKGFFEYNYFIYELPLEPTKEINHPGSENPPVDVPKVDNQGQINTNKQNTKKQIDKIDKTNFIENNKKNISDEHHSITKDLINRKYLDNDDTELHKYDNLFKELLLEYEFIDIITITHYIISSVVQRHFKDEYDNKIDNKFGYLKTSILNNIEMFKNKEIEWDEELGWFKENNKEDLFEYEYDYF